MYKQVEKPKENKSRVVANAAAQKKSRVKQGVGFVDNRSEVIIQRKPQEMLVNNPSQLQQSIQKKSNTIQRVITVTKEQLVYSNAKWAFKSLKSTFDGIEQRDLLAILEIMNEKNENFPDFRNLKAAIEEKDKSIKELNEYEVNPREWAVLHRLKSQSFDKFIKAKYGDDTNLREAKKKYEDSNARYDPSKFGEGKGHNWNSNALWLEHVEKNFSKAVLTDLPLSETNIYRQTQGKTGFSAYAREIASLLYQEFYPIGKNTLPATESWNTVAMVKEDLIPETIRPEIKKKITINDDNAMKIFNDQNDDIGTHATFTFFKNAGLPTNRRQKDITQSLHELAPSNSIVQKLKGIIPNGFDWNSDNKADWQNLFQQYKEELKWQGINGWKGVRRQARIHRVEIVN